MKFGKFEQQPKINPDNNTIGYEPKLSAEKIDEIRTLLARQENTDLFSETESKELEKLAGQFPLEYAAAQGEEAPVEDGGVLDTQRIAANLREAGKESIARRVEDIDKLPDFTEDDVEAYLNKLGETRKDK